MNIHEFQAKQLFERFGVATPAGQVAETPEAAADAARAITGGKIVVKAQIHAGGRGKGTFTNGFQGGVHICDDADQAAEFAAKMLGQTLVTHQTGDQGKLVRQVLVAKAVDIANEFYLAILMDRATERPVVVASSEGGVDIEEVAESRPQAIIREPINPLLGLQPFQARKIAAALGLPSDKIAAGAKLILALHELFASCDCSMVEVNPLVLTTSGEVLALDAKFNFDDSALYRHPEIAALHDPEEEDPREVEASKFNLNYIGLEGNIACMVNGAGLAMATMDIIKHFGGEPANFLDVGGGASEDQVTQAFRIPTEDPNVKAILVNIFGGIMKCDVIAQGIINAAKSIKMQVPLVVRLEGTNVEQGKALLAQSGLDIIAADDLADAARKAVQAA